MTRIILSGAGGAMGRVVAEYARESGRFTVVAGIDIITEQKDDFHVFKNLLDCTVPADAVIDFSHPAALEPLLSAAVPRKLPVVIATTGLSSSQIAKIHKAAESIPVFFSFNMSLGISLMVELAKIAARVLGSDFDVEIMEKHHNKKIDAPSGTALMLADGVSSVLGDDLLYAYNRNSSRKPRGKNEIGIHSIRGGTIVGEHDILFAGKDEIITISHSAGSKKIFATGALSAAEYIAGKAPGLYSMSDLI
ncbi:MAG: 4-hydroxy-tetrahydrodipicolinate reductase [Oscillospiraceae bacterium]|nr:4-hydroxy-tetrahydrodipicolinate reductase [Oscillospiraceae bacterium]